MSSELRIHAEHTGGMRMSATNGEHTVNTDYPLKADEKVTALKPMELLLVSLAACGGSVVNLLLAKMVQKVSRLEVNAQGAQRDEHPIVFTHIEVEFVIHGSQIDSGVVEKAIAQADRQLCPVWAMVKPATTITTSYRIVET